MNISVKKIRPSAILPSYQTEHSAGLDLAADIAEAITLAPQERKAIATGIAVAIPEGYEIQLRARSGLALKHGIALANGVGTIDADFRGEIHVLLINQGTESFTIEPGMRIAQMVVARYERIAWEEVEELNETSRGEGGYGHTGV